MYQLVDNDVRGPRFESVLISGSGKLDETVSSGGIVHQKCRDKQRK